MMEQYFQIKQNYPDTLLFFRLGDFYEMFFDDAKTASKELELVLTGRDCGQEERAPMCGVPFHSADSYIAKLVSRGYKVAICEQVEDPATAKGIVKRDVVRIVTPGTVIESNMLDESKNNYLASVFLTDKNCGLAFIDVSTGEVHLDRADSGDSVAHILNRLGCYNPSEVIINKYGASVKSIIAFM
jgi:DNA mismatch repair protein MutS